MCTDCLSLEPLLKKDIRPCYYRVLRLNENAAEGLKAKDSLQTDCAIGTFVSHGTEASHPINLTVCDWSPAVLNTHTYTLGSRPSFKGQFIPAASSFEQARDCWAGVFRTMVQIDTTKLDDSVIVIPLHDPELARRYLGGRTLNMALASGEVLFRSLEALPYADCLIPRSAITEIERYPIAGRGIKPSFSDDAGFPTIKNLQHVKLLQDIPVCIQPEAQLVQPKWPNNL